MRKLKTADIPKAARLIKSLGVKDKFREAAQKANSDEANSDEAVSGFGFDFIWDLFDVATEQKGEQAIYEFLAGPFEMTAQEVADLDLTDLIDGLKRIAQENNLTAFFKAAAGLMK